MRPFQWGILGTGFAARNFVLGLQAAQDARAAAVASRSLEKAREFARGLGIRRAFGDYEEAVHDSEVDAFYVATPPSRHRDHALLCLNAGKPVLVEKPFAIDSAQARNIVETARAQSVFCMEGMWTRFLPLVRRVKQMVEDGVVGEVRMLTGGFCAAEAFRPDNNLYNPELGGGALLDRGVYPISLAFHLLGAPDTIFGDATIGETGVDEQAAAIFRYEGGGLALLYASLRTQSPNDCVIMGTRARIHVHPPIYRPFRMTLTSVHEKERAPSGRSWAHALKESHWVHDAHQRFSRLASSVLDRNSTHYTERYAGNGYHYEADEVMHCVRSGKLESAVMPLSESLAIMEAMDTVRSHWTVRTEPATDGRTPA